MQQRLDALPPDLAHRRFFLGTYLRTTLAVGQAIDTGRFTDPTWVERWDVVFAELFIRAHDADRAGRPADVPRPWRLASTPRRTSRRCDTCCRDQRARQLRPAAGAARRHQRRRLHRAGDPRPTSPRPRADRRRPLGPGRGRGRRTVSSGGRALLDRVLAPLNRLGSKRFLRESRQKVWHNTIELQRARLAGPAAYDDRLAELEVLSAARIADLLGARSGHPQAGGGGLRRNPATAARELAEVSCSVAGCSAAASRSMLAGRARGRTTSRTTR